MHCFVDDPIGSIRGDSTTRKIAVTTMVLCWEALGFGLSYRKGQLGSSVVWIGGKLEFNSEGIQASIKESIIEDIVEALKRYCEGPLR